MPNACCRAARGTHDQGAFIDGPFARFLLRAIAGQNHNRWAEPFNKQVHVVKNRCVNSGLPGFFLCALLTIGSSMSALAQTYPHQGIKIIMPFPAGGGADAVGRIIAQHLNDSMGQSVIVENVVGAGGTIGTARAAQAAADGYTLFVGTPSTHGTNVAVYPKLAYDPVKDFAPIALIATSPLMLIAAPTLPAASVADLIKLARDKPGELAFGSFGTGSINHLAIELFQSMANIRTNHIPYRGSAPAMTDLIAGRIHYTVDGPAALSFIKASTVKLLGVGSSQRWNVFPDTPTIAESGVAGYEALTWFGLFAPAATPKPILEILNSKLNAALTTDRAKQSFEKLGLDAAGGAPDVLAKTVQDEIRKWVDIARDKNIRIEP
jgi:tripartite-type tricarboxylate transporter receptor subunit TctC